MLSVLDLTATGRQAAVATHDQMVEMLKGELKECHSLIQRGAERLAADIFEQEVVPTLHRIMAVQEELTGTARDDFMALKYGSYMDLAGFIAEKGIKKRGR